MPKIDLSFNEFIDVIGSMRSWIDELERFSPDEACRLKSLYQDLHERFARATVEAQLHPEEVR